MKCVSPSTDLVIQQLPFTPSEVGLAVNANPFHCNVGNSKWLFTSGSYGALSRPSDCKSFCRAGVVVVVTVGAVVSGNDDDGDCGDAEGLEGTDTSGEDPSGSVGCAVADVDASAGVAVAASSPHDPGTWDPRSAAISASLAPMDCSIAALRCTPPDPDADPDGWGVLLAMVLVPSAG